MADSAPAHHAERAGPRPSARLERPTRKEPVAWGVHLGPCRFHPHGAPACSGQLGALERQRCRTGSNAPPLCGQPGGSTRRQNVSAEINRRGSSVDANYRIDRACLSRFVALHDSEPAGRPGTPHMSTPRTLFGKASPHCSHSHARFACIGLHQGCSVAPMVWNRANCMEEIDDSWPMPAMGCVSIPLGFVTSRGRAPHGFHATSATYAMHAAQAREA